MSILHGILNMKHKDGSADDSQLGHHFQLPLIWICLRHTSPYRCVAAVPQASRRSLVRFTYRLEYRRKFMSIIAEYRRCLKCGRIYSFNPDIGKFFCPVCGPSGFSWIVGKPKKKKDK